MTSCFTWEGEWYSTSWYLTSSERLLKTQAVSWITQVCRRTCSSRCIAMSVQQLRQPPYAQRHGHKTWVFNADFPPNLTSFPAEYNRSSQNEQDFFIPRRIKEFYISMELWSNNNCHTSRKLIPSHWRTLMKMHAHTHTHTHTNKRGHSVYFSHCLGRQNLARN